MAWFYPPCWSIALASLVLFVRAQGHALAADVRDQIHRVRVAAALQLRLGTGQALNLPWHGYDLGANHNSIVNFQVYYMIPVHTCTVLFDTI